MRRQEGLQHTADGQKIAGRLTTERHNVLSPQGERELPQVFSLARAGTIRRVVKRRLQTSAEFLVFAEPVCTCGKARRQEACPPCLDGLPAEVLGAVCCEE